jgi:hypothetical protein
MKIQTAINQLEKERQFLGLGLFEILKDIQKNPMAYSAKSIQAYHRFMVDNYKIFGNLGGYND